MDTQIQQILKNARSVLLVDWPDESLPVSLIKAGFIVFSYSPDDYCEAVLENEKLSFNKMPSPPQTVDIVNIFRPEHEQEAIIAKHVLPLHARVVWLHPPVAATMGPELSSLNGLLVVKGTTINSYLRF